MAHLKHLYEEPYESWFTFRPTPDSDEARDPVSSSCSTKTDGGNDDDVATTTTKTDNDDGPLAVGMHIAIQCRRKRPWSRGHAYNVMRWLMKIETYDGASGEFTATMYEWEQLNQDSDDSSGRMSEENYRDGDVKVCGKIETQNYQTLFTDYPAPSRKGTGTLLTSLSCSGSSMNVFSRVSGDPTFSG